MASVWIIDDDPAMRWILERALQATGISCQSFEAAEPAVLALCRHAPDVLITDIRLPGDSGLDLLQRLRITNLRIPVIVMTAHSDLSNALLAYEAGAFEYLPKPFDINEAVALVNRALQAHQTPTVERLSVPETEAQLIGHAPSMQSVYRAIGRLATSSVTVLITGESGTGKELVARSLHEHSPRARKPFIAINTAALAAELMESELFGHEKGAFTGAVSQRCGHFEQADGGTLFLDEIGDMSAALQTRLLRVLAEGNFYRVGGQAPVHVDVRVVAATHQDLYERVRNGLFREDLYYRLNVIRIELPALRERQQDIPGLLQHYARVAAQELGVAPKSFSEEALSKLTSYDWPGNIRELVNLCRRVCALSVGNEVRPEDLPPTVLAGRPPPRIEPAWTKALTAWADRNVEAARDPLVDLAKPQFERTLIISALKHAHGSRQDAARLIGWGRNTLTRKMKELDLSEADLEVS
jgi:two-component system, NtrC family, nitrogen regulation response regulator GlnG